MNTLNRLCAAGVLLGVAALFSGCVQDTSRPSAGARNTGAKVVEEFSVVESSTDKELTPAQIADLRQAVANYLKEQGLSDGRTYYVRVTFPSDSPDADPQWAVVRISSHAARTYTVIAAYPGADDYDPFDFYRGNYSYANYYPGYYGFSRWGYYDPFDYNYGYYRPPTPPRDPVRPTDPNRPVDPHKPTDPTNTSAHPHGPRNRWDKPPTTDDDQSRGNPPRRNPDPQRWNRPEGRPGAPENPRAPRPATSDSNSGPSSRSYTPPASDRSYSPPTQSYSPPAAPSYSPPPASDNSSRSVPPPNSGQLSRDQER